MLILNFCLESFGLNIHTTIKKNYIKIMPSSTSHKKIIFFIIYLLEDEQELSLGMLDTSQTYL